MKRPLTMTALSVVLCLAMLATTGCTVAPTTNNAAALNSNVAAPVANSNNAGSSGASPNAGAVAEAITSKEKQIWDAIKSKNYDAFGNMLSSDMVYVSTDGIHDKAATISGVKNLNATEVNLSDWKTVVLDEDAAVVTYTVEVKGTSDGQPVPPGAMRASSAWVKRGAEWVAVYHQDSMVEAAPASSSSPPPAAETSKPASGAANSNAPASATEHAGIAASDDPVAIEKHLWDALRRKDWDAFAAYMAAEQVEVEPNGVYDRAGTLAAVRQVDFSKFTTSDHKATKLDDDATLVTYMVKGPGPDGKLLEERASTIWAKRGGKWMAYFHQGTPVEKMPAK